jgi:predicted metal-dependent enzyme (double-stranded beta helix superfamily)
MDWIYVDGCGRIKVRNDQNDATLRMMKGTSPAILPDPHFAVFVSRFGEVVERAPGGGEAMLAEGARLLRDLVSADDWLSDRHARAHPLHYCQYLLHLDPRERFSITSFVWGPGQQTPIHDHGVWGLVGMLRGAELITKFDHAAPGTAPIAVETHRLDPPTVEIISSATGDVHQVCNAYPDQDSISIHIYGGNIGTISRNIITEHGESKTFVSPYTEEF